MPVCAIAQRSSSGPERLDACVAAALPTLPAEGKSLSCELDAQVIAGPVSHPRTSIVEFLFANYSGFVSQAAVLDQKPPILAAADFVKVTRI